MTRLLLLVFAALSALPASAAPQARAPASGNADPCIVANPTGGDIRVVSCTLRGGRAYRLTANFQGGHDDTSASLTASLDGKSTACAPDSKMALFGEDGDVSLSCRIDAVDHDTADHALVVTVLWSHAQYRDVLLSEQ